MVVEPETPQERAAVVVWALRAGEVLSTQDVARLTGLSEDRSRRLVDELCRVLPIVSLRHEGKRYWMWLQPLFGSQYK